MSDDPRLTATLAAIDAANAADPDRSEGQPAARLYAERMSEALARFVPGAGDLLRIAARGQHIERWTRPRADYPEGREGYLRWRHDLAAFHAARVGEIMAQAGYGADAIAQVGRMLRKEGLKHDPLVQTLEDVIALTFLRWYARPFAAGRDPAEVQRIVEKTARKMSPAGRAAARSGLDLPPALAAALAEPAGR